MSEPHGVQEEEEGGRGLQALRALLSPPPVPDGAWYAATASMVVSQARAEPSKFLTDPSNHRACYLMIAGLRSGLFRTQSTLLDCVASLLDAPDLDVLEILAADAETPLAHAALALCEEQEPAVGSQQASTELARDGGESREEEREEEREGEGEEEGEEDSPAREAEEGVAGHGRAPRTEDEDVAAAQRHVNQMCCENPMDCEEPTVREAAFNLLAKLSTYMLRPCSPRLESLLYLCTSVKMVSSRMVSKTAGRALSCLLQLELQRDSERELRRFFRRSLRGVGTMVVETEVDMFIKETEMMGGGEEGEGAGAGAKEVAERESKRKCLGLEHRRRDELWNKIFEAVLQLKDGDLPRECCMQTSSVRLALIEVTRHLLQTARGRRTIRRYDLMLSILVLLKRSGFSVFKTVCSHRKAAESQLDVLRMIPMSLKTAMKTLDPSRDVLNNNNVAIVNDMFEAYQKVYSSCRRTFLMTSDQAFQCLRLNAAEDNCKPLEAFFSWAQLVMLLVDNMLQVGSKIRVYIHLQRNVVSAIGSLTQWKDVGISTAAFRCLLRVFDNLPVLSWKWLEQTAVSGSAPDDDCVFSLSANSNNVVDVLERVSMSSRRAMAVRPNMPKLWEIRCISAEFIAMVLTRTEVLERAESFSSLAPSIFRVLCSLCVDKVDFVQAAAISSLSCVHHIQKFLSPQAADDVSTHVYRGLVNSCFLLGKSLAGGTWWATRCGGEEKAPKQQWSKICKKICDDVDWEVQLRGLELLRRLGGIADPPLVSPGGSWTLDMSEEGREQNAFSALLPSSPGRCLRNNGGGLLFWEADGGALLESLLASSDRPIRLSCAVLLLRLHQQLANESLELVRLPPGSFELAARSQGFLQRLPDLVRRSSFMLQTQQGSAQQTVELTCGESETGLDCMD
ncbi:hypothetical protein GUITHDRAFT_138448 [Guillardia theta CCMP2712]|uniref:Uncharacterized protein n=1 Tax=Guillardia theta (strain CCMP2712) TaxID=905079 RepID=L1JCV7_GUITC|nr:hypothetical protein GUITHDRAFT_138448 [Guillardia theta CCMP2712]EKX45954.1 hypothetical protein GUITHDRAFT_138448 [Guillardia theta CCMP2712]|eukprot:XP_005832934.1 hypothetical protein GUITHDRAFT_138448 [Guillardia theta CCMP2712]